MGLFDNLLNSDLKDVGDVFAENCAKSIEEKNFEKNCLAVVTFDRCKKWALDMKKEYPQSAGFVVAVKDNPDPQNENDKICVIIGMIDEKNKVVTMDGKMGISTIFHGGTIDSKMLDELNGNSSKIYRFK